VGREHQKSSVTPSHAPSVPNTPPIAPWWCSLISDYFGLALTILILVTVAPFTPGLLSQANLLNIFSYLLPLLIVAIGMTLVMITGGIDLSVTSIIALTSVVGAKLMTTSSQPAAIGIIAMLTLGASIGAANGAIITLLRLPAFIVTLASMMFVSGFAVWFTQSKNIDQLPRSFLAIGQRLPIAATLAIVVAAFTAFYLRKTIYGRWLYAVGQNATAAHISGIPVRRVTVAAYVSSGLCAAIASIILTARLETASPVLGREMLLDIIGATVIGGISLFGGKGKISWTFFGVLFLVTLDNALNLLNLSQFAITITKGAGILLAATLDALRQRWGFNAT
jgi:ribose/xylose/arabinose/galactoside ABC-type transport system permease subunit